RAGHVKNVDLVLADKLGDQPRGVFGGNFWSVDQFVRPLLLHAEAYRLFRATAQFARVNNDGSIGVFHVLQGALGESTMFQFPDWITIRNPTKFIETSGRTPTAAIDSIL